MTDRHDDEFFEPKDQAEIAAVRLQQNPYAKLSWGRGATASSEIDKSVRTAAKKNTASQREFESEAKRILGFYVPPLEKGKLRPAYKSFIDRNLSRSPEVRFKLLAELKKYDLSTSGGVRSHFNREDFEITELKLRAIELAAGIRE
jgi:hypothetical protein